MDETYWMLGKEHQADLDREAQKRRSAAVAGPRAVQPKARRSKARKLLVLMRPRHA